MIVHSMFPMIASHKLDESLRFYGAFGFEPVFYNGWYLHLKRAAPTPVELGFLRPEHETQPPPFQTRFDGKGLFLGLAVEEVDRVHDELASAGHNIIVSLRDEPWGQRHFAIRDPNGVVLDIIGEIEPDAAWMAAQPDLIRESRRAAAS